MLKLLAGYRMKRREHPAETASNKVYDRELPHNWMRKVSVGLWLMSWYRFQSHFFSYSILLLVSRLLSFLKFDIIFKSLSKSTNVIHCYSNRRDWQIIIDSLRFRCRELWPVLVLPSLTLWGQSSRRCRSTWAKCVWQCSCTYCVYWQNAHGIRHYEEAPSRKSFWIY